MDNNHFKEWEDYKEEEDMCKRCWILGARKVLVKFKKIDEPEKCKLCLKPSVEVQFSCDNGGYFSRSKCYACDPLHKGEVVKNKTRTDELLHYTRKYMNEEDANIEYDDELLQLEQAICFFCSKVTSKYLRCYVCVSRGTARASCAKCIERLSDISVEMTCTLWDYEPWMKYKEDSLVQNGDLPCESCLLDVVDDMLRKYKVSIFWNEPNEEKLCRICHKEALEILTFDRNTREVRKTCNKCAPKVVS
jgi:hypothetical protein